MEKIKAFFQNEKVKSFRKKVFNKKTFISALVIIVLVIALRVSFYLIFRVEGTVSKVDGSQITVVNFLGTKTVDVGTLQTSASNIQVGDRVEITKNLSGDVMSVRDGNNRGFKGRGNGNGNPNNGGRNGFKGNRGRNLMRKR